jgi:hypothetical protein
MKLIDQILHEIQAAAASGDLEKISRMNQMAKRVQEIEAGKTAFAAELAEIATKLKDGGSTEQPTFALIPRHSGPLTVEIDFPRLGTSHPNVVISERQASDTMRRVIEALVAAKGAGILQALAQVRVNRGPLVSNQPKRDYNNSRSGQLYAHQPIGSTGYSVLTHSSTAEKVRDLRMVGERLGYSSLHFRVRKSEAGTDD